jgi:hypothetical protein
VLLNLGLSFINSYFMGDQLQNPQAITVLIVLTVLMLGLAYLVRQGKNWIKYLLLVLFVIGLIPAISIMTVSPIPIATLNMVQNILQLWIIILLFTIPKTPSINDSEVMTQV